MKRFILLLTLVMGCQLLLMSQQQSYAGYMEAGDEAVAQHDHYSAYQFYRIALEFPKKENDPVGLTKLAEAAHKARAYRVSNEALLRLATLPEAATFPKLHYYLGDNYLRTAQYDLAALHFQTFLDEQPGADPALRAKAELAITDANWAIGELALERDISMQHLGTPINSEYSDFGYTKRENGDVYFSSIKFDYKKDTLIPARKLSKILQRKPGQEPEPLGDPLDSKDRHISHSTFNSSGEVMLYSLCEYVNYDDVSCQIYRVDVGPDGNFSNSRPVEALNQAGSSNRMPSFGQLLDGREVIFFSSDREGGTGGLDLYVAQFSADGTIGEVEELTELNTPANDVTPFFYNDRQALFFATDGRFTFGGLDIYKTYLDGEDFSQPINLGSPVNSSYDDAYYSQFPQDELAHLSSTRQAPDAIFFSEDKEVCCYDIYAFEPDDRIDLLARTFNKLTEEELLGATVVLCEITPDGPVIIEEFTNLEGNEFNFKLEADKRYELKATKQGFTKVIDAFDLTDPELSRLGFIRRDLYLAPSVELDVFTFNGNDDSALNGVRVALYEIDAEGNEILLDDKIDLSANNVSFTLDAGKRYVVKGNKDGFGEATEGIDLRDYSPDGSERLRRDLYLGQLLEILVVDGVTGDPLTGATVDLSRIGGKKVGVKTNPDGNDFEFVVNLNRPFLLTTSRPGYLTRTDTLTFTPEQLAQNNGKLRFVVPLFNADLDALLPVSVFFDNDHPNPKSYRTTTDLSYRQTFNPYYNRRETFINEFTEGMERNDAFVVAGRFEQFFDLQVKGGMERLKAFAQLLEAHLGSGNSFSLQLKGYASPRAASEYNRRLSARRNDAVRNFFREYNNRALLPYIESGKLKFSDAALGESTADAATISDRLDNPRESVFSIIASLERRVEISNADRSTGRKKK